MRRREFIAVLGGAVTLGPLGVRAQPSALPVIGFLNTTDPNTAHLDTFRNGLAETGYHEGQNVAIEYRWAEGRYDRLPALAAELVQRRVAVIVTGGGSVSARAASAATSTIPIVALTGADPVIEGLAGSLSRPGGNVTGVSQLVTASAAKRLEFLHELVPAADAIAYLENPALPGSDRVTQKIAAEAGTLGAKLSVVKASSDADIVAAFETLSRERIGALLVGADPFFFMQRDRLVALSARHSLPTMYFFREFVAAGGLISYGTRLAEGYHQVGVYAGRILKGANPADLPIAQQSEKIELVINRKTANALGLAIPPSLLARTDEVFE